MAKKNTDTGQVTEIKENDNVQSSEQETAVLTVPGKNKPDLYDPKFVKEAMKHKDNIGKEFGKIDKSIFKVAFEVYWLYDNNAYIPLGYDNIYDLAKAEFGIARGTTSDYINMVCRFGKRDELDNFTGKIMEKYEAYSSSKLIAMHDLLDSEIDSHLKPEMSVREIKGIVNKVFGKSDEKLPENESDSGKGKENESSEKDMNKTFKLLDNLIKDSKAREQDRPDSEKKIDTGVSISDPQNTTGSETTGNKTREVVVINGCNYSLLCKFTKNFFETDDWKDRIIKDLEDCYKENPHRWICIGYV